MIEPRMRGQFLFSTVAALLAVALQCVIVSADDVGCLLSQVTGAFALTIRTPSRFPSLIPDAVSAATCPVMLR